MLNSCMANMDLRLYRTAAAGTRELVDVSRSAVDNVEHIFARELPRGRYTIEVSTDRAWTYALAWDAQPAVTAPLSPSIIVQAPTPASPASGVSIRPVSVIGTAVASNAPVSDDDR